MPDGEVMVMGNEEAVERYLDVGITGQAIRMSSYFHYDYSAGHSACERLRHRRAVKMLALVVQAQA